MVKKTYGLAITYYKTKFFKNNAKEIFECKIIKNDKIYLKNSENSPKIIQNIE